MNFKGQLKPNEPRPLAQCGTMVAPKQDARWRDLSKPMLDVEVVMIHGFGFHQLSIDRLDAVEIQRWMRDAHR